MDPFWKTFFEDFKDRGRDATPFLITLAALAGLCLGVGIVTETGLADFLVPALVCAGIFALVWTVVTVGRARRRRHERWERRELSRDEWRAARSKLLKDRNRKSL